MKKHRLLSPRAMLITAMTVFGTLGPFVRNISVASAELALYRAVLAALLILAFLGVSRQDISLRGLRRELPLLLVSGVAMGFNWILLFEAYKYTTISAATLSYYFAPVLVTLACPVLFGERMTRKQWLCSAVATLGIVLVTGVGDLSQADDHLRGVAFGLAAACLYAFVILVNKRIRDVDGIRRTFLQFSAAVLVLAPYVALTDGFSLASLSAVGWACLLVVGLVHTGLNYCLYFTAMKELPGQKTAILSYIDPLVAVLISVLVLGEPLSLLQALGGALILGGALWNELPGPDGTRS